MDENAVQLDGLGASVARAIDEAIAPYREANAALQENLDEVTLMFRVEDRGWTLLGELAAGERIEGLSLSELKDISKAIRPHVVGDGLVKHGVDVHSGYVWGKGLNIEGVQREAGRRGAPTDVEKFFKNPINQDSIFSSLSHEEIQKARYTDGNLFMACNISEKTVRRVPLEQISSIKVNPDFPEEIWAYKRTWDPKPDDPKSKEVSRWYYTPRIPKAKKQQSYTVDGETTSVDTNIILVDRRFNRQVGYPLGIPDATAAMPWIAAYTEIMQYGRVVNESLAKILFKIISKSKNGANNAAVKVSGAGGFGNTASMVEGQDIQAINSAGKGYEFSNARAVGAMAAAALNISVIEMLSDSSAAGSSYGAAQTLAPSTKNAMRLMQAQWIEMYGEIFGSFNLDFPRIWFESLEDIDPYRAAQGLTLLSTTLSDEEYRGKALDLLDIPGDPNKVPEILKTRTTLAKTQASPDQGKANGTGGQDSGTNNDQRTDTQSSSEALLHAMQTTDFLDRFESLVERMEAAN